MEKNQLNSSQHRIVWVDWMRVAACFMVMMVHATEPFYLGGDGSRILTIKHAATRLQSTHTIRCC